MSIVSAAFERREGWCAASAKSWLEGRGVHSPQLVVDGNTHILCRARRGSLCASASRLETRKIEPGVILVLDVGDALEFMQKWGGGLLATLSDGPKELEKLVGAVEVNLMARLAKEGARPLEECSPYGAEFLACNGWTVDSAVSWCAELGWNVSGASDCVEESRTGCVITHRSPCFGAHTSIRDVTQHPTSQRRHNTVALLLERCEKHAVGAARPIRPHGRDAVSALSLCEEMAAAAVE